MATEKILVGNVKVVSTQYGDITKIGFKAEDLDMLKSHIKGGWVNLDIKVGKSGKSYMEVSQFAPKQGGGAPAQSNKGGEIASPMQPQNTDDLPF